MAAIFAIHHHLDSSVPTDDASPCTWWCAPLHLVQTALANRSDGAVFAPHDFAPVGRHRRSGRPDIITFERSSDRRRIHVDEIGQTYRFLAPQRRDSRSLGQFRPHRGITDLFAEFGPADT